MIRIELNNYIIEDIKLIQEFQEYGFEDEILQSLYDNIQKKREAKQELNK